MKEEGHPTIDRELLLAQTGWVRSVAHSLVRDPGGAEDVAQETMLAALTSPPRDAADARRLRAWLGRVAYNLAHLLTRRNMQRRAREHRAARDELQDSTADRVLRSAGLKLVLDAVTKLEPAYREVVVLRYFDGLSTAEIADRVGTTDNAVRKRLWRARARLRHRLDTVHEGDRKAWFNALAPLLGETTHRVASVRRASLLKPLAGLAAGTAIVATAALAGAFSPEIERPTVETASVAPSLSRGERLGVAPPPLRREVSGQVHEGGATGLLRQQGPERLVDPVPEVPAGEEPVSRGEPTWVRGRVVDLEGQPLEGMAVVDAASPDEILAVTAPDGGFLAEEVRPPVLLEARQEGFACLRGSAVEESLDRDGHLLVAAPSVPLAGHVRDEAGRHLPGARLAVRYGTRLYLGLDRPLAETVPVVAGARSDRQGAFALDAVVVSTATSLEATLEGFEPVSILVQAVPTAPLTLVLREGARPLALLHGQVFTPSGDPIPGADVRVGTARSRTDASGRFALRLDGPIRGATLVARKEGFEPGVLHDVEALTEVHGGLALTLAPLRGTLVGHVVDAEGRPVRDWLVSAVDVTSIGGRTPEAAAERPSPGAGGPGGSLAEKGDDDDEGSKGGDKTNDDGSFSLSVRSGIEYVVFAYDPETLLHACSEPVIPNGVEKVELEARTDALYPELAGRVVTTDGAPVLGASVTVTLDGPGVPMSPQGRSVRADEQGLFAVRDVPHADAVLRVEHPAVETSFHALERGAEPVVVVRRRAHARLALDPASSADAFAFLDAEGERLPQVGPAGRALQGELFGGRSAVVQAPLASRYLATYRTGREVARMAIGLSEGEVTILER